MAWNLPHTAELADFPRRISVLAATILFSVITVFVTTPLLHAQKQMKDRYIAMAVLDQLNPSVAHPTASDYTVTVWEDERHADVRGADIYIQKISNETGVSQWVADPLGGTYGPWDVVTERFDGIPVCTAVEDQRNPRAAYDGMNGVIVVWEDYRNDPTMAVAEIYAQRIDLATGKPDPAWPVNGVAVCQTGYHAERPRIAGTVDGAYMTWVDYRNDPGYAPRDRDIYVQYINSATATWPPAPTNWTANGIPVATNQPPDQINPELAVDNIFTLDLLGNLTQGVVVTYQDDRYPGATFGTPVWSVFANRIDANGVQMYTAGVPPFQADVAAGSSFENQELPRLVTTGQLAQAPNPSAVIVWQDAVQNPTLGYTDIYAQRLDQFGNPLFPGMNGLSVCQAPQGQTIPIPTLWESGDPSLGTYVPYVTIGWEDRRNVQQGGVDIYAALVDATSPGALVNPQGISGEPVCTLPYDQTQLSMDNLYHANTGQEYSIFVWTHQTATGRDIRFQKVMLPAWMEMYQPDGKEVTGAKSDQILPQANREVFVWQDGRRDPIPHDDQDDENIYCQTPGMCTGPTDMKWRDVFAKWTYGRDAREFRHAVNPDDGSTFVVWTEDRQVYPSSMHSIVFIQKLDKDGVPRWSNNGVAVNGYYNNQQGSTSAAGLPDVCIANTGGAFVVWQQSVFQDATKQECPGAKFDAMGNATYILFSWSWNVPPKSESYTEPRIVSGSNGAAAVAVLKDDRPLGGTRNVPIVDALSASGGRLGVGGLIATDAPPVSVNDNQGLKFVYDNVSTYYTMTTSLTPGTSGLVLGAFDINNGSNANLIPYQNLDNYDLSIQDYISAATRSCALYTYSIQPQPGSAYDVWAGYYRWNGGIQSFWNTQITSSMPGVNSRQPSICADSVYNGNSGEQGFILAWDTDYQYPGYPLYHRVETNRYRITQATRIVPEFTSPFILASGLSAASYPDVARVPNSTPSGMTRGVVVWEGGGETGPCSPARPTEIYGQYVFYDLNAANPGPQWTQAEMIAPGVGNYHQTRPNVQPAGSDAVSVFWFDDQAGDDGVMGTTLPNLHQSIAWAKDRHARERSTPDAGLTISGVWPQPASIAANELQVSVAGRKNEDAVLELYDVLGRKAAILYRGVMWQSDMAVRFSPSQLQLRPGVYVLRLRSGDAAVTRTLTILR